MHNSFTSIRLLLPPFPFSTPQDQWVVIQNVKEGSSTTAGKNSVDAFSPEPCVQEPPQRHMPVRKPASLKPVTAVWKPVGVIACCRDVRISVFHLIPVSFQGFDIAKHHSQPQPLITHSILDESPPFPAQARNPRSQEVRFSGAILIFFE